MGKIIRPSNERKLTNKNRTTSRVSGSDGRDASRLGTTSTWAGAKKAKIQNTTTWNLGRIARVEKTAPDDSESADDAVLAIDHEQEEGLEKIEGFGEQEGGLEKIEGFGEQEEGLEKIEGFDWSDDDLRMETDLCVKPLNHRLPDYDDEGFWALLEEGQIKELKIRLALYRIRAHEGERLKGMDKAEISAMYPPASLEDQGYYKWCERNFEWYFDPEFCEQVGFEDYQRLVLRNNGEYEHWEYYRETCNTLQGDQEYVQFWEKLSSETKWIENARSASSRAWDKLERVAFYQAVRIAADFNNIFTTLIYSGFTEYMWTAQFVNTWYKDFTYFYSEIWKRVAKQKMDFKEALKQVFDNGVPSSCRVEMQLELKSLHLVTPGPVAYNYETYLAGIDGNVSEDKARVLIREAVEIFVSRHKTYYDYAKKKLDIAKKIGLISSPPALTKSLQTDS